MHPTRCTFVDAHGTPCDDWADDGDRCPSHPRRPARVPALRMLEED